MICILEGPDGSGKTQLGRYLAEHRGLTFRRLQQPPPDDQSPLEYFGDDLEAHRGEDVVYDRLSHSELVYGPILRGHSRIDQKDSDALRAIIADVKAIEILCLPPYTVCLQSWRSGRHEYIIDEHLFKRTYLAYQIMASRPGIWLYDFTQPYALQNLLGRLDSVRSQRSSKLSATLSPERMSRGNVKTKG